MIETVTIVGVGLIGGSFALGLKETGFQGRILGVSSERTLETAKRMSVIDQGVPLEEGVRQADLVYLAQPISQILEVIPRIGPWLGPEAVVTDAGSTKVQIDRMAQTHLPPGSFVGGHPMAGKESRGVEAAEGGLFRNRPYILTPSSHPQRANVQTLVELIRQLGCRIIELAPDTHDRMIAYYSHVPQIASTALAVTVSRTGSTRSIAGPGLIDMTRLAMSSYAVWKDILDTNESEIGPALDAYISVLKELRNTLRSPEMSQSFDSACRLAKSVRSDF
ncbi:MAG: prephenate dehydrogenase/arogenate dehydrogenase family protein [Acidobacteria bacterium]|nr:prephenate dehydrogenase/arogenate dehydrogenase family protein [Acidobacteriota bacterium]